VRSKGGFLRIGNLFRSDTVRTSIVPAMDSQCGCTSLPSSPLSNWSP